MRAPTKFAALVAAAIAMISATACSTSPQSASTTTSSATSGSSVAPKPLPISTSTLPVVPTTIVPAGGVGTTVGLPPIGSSAPALVTLVQVVDPAQAADQFAVPVGGDRFVGVQLRVAFGGTSSVQEDLNADTTIEDAQGNLYQPAVANLQNCPAFNAGLSLAPTKSALGCVTFEVAATTKVKEVIFTPGAQFGSVSAEWVLP